jgi:hypothetical protein
LREQRRCGGASNVHPQDELEERVMKFVSAQTNFPFARLTLKTTLADDIGLAGDEAGEFFERFSRRFGVAEDSFTKLDFDRHFGSEGCLSLGCLGPFLLLAVPFLIAAF